MIPSSSTHILSSRPQGRTFCVPQRRDHGTIATASTAPSFVRPGGKGGLLRSHFAKPLLLALFFLRPVSFNFHLSTSEPITP